MMKKVAAGIICILLSFAAVSTELTVSVSDRELEMPLEGVVLKLAGTDIFSETGNDGIAILRLPDDFMRGTLTAILPGYENLKTTVVAGQTDLTLGMSIGDVVEGRELVVERAVPGKSDAASGISIVMDSRDMQATAEIGIVEDIMSSVKTLPGVGFAGGWNAQPSIRGGYPEEMGTVLDGVYILAPWHWGGAFSIFNPNMVDTVKMSHGIFSARYGRAMSGLLEVTTVKPSSSLVRIETGISTTSTDFFTQIPLGPTAGLFTGGKVTYMETLQWVNDGLGLKPKLADTIPTMPYIRDFYTKAYYTPTNELDISVNGFFGSDGIGIKQDVMSDATDGSGGLRTTAKFDWLNLQGFAATDVKWMASRNALVHFIGAYNNNTMDADILFDRSGSNAYSDAFLAEYDGMPGIDTDGTAGTINGMTGYSVDHLGTSGFSRVSVHQGQAKLETDMLMAGGSVVSFGGEEIFQLVSTDQEFTYWEDSYETGTLTYEEKTQKQNLEGNRVLNSSAFVLWSYGSEADVLNGEAGLRFEHFYLWNEVFKLNTYPVANPRLSVRWTPVRNGVFPESVVLSAGTGLYSMFPIDALAADKSNGIKSFEVGPNRAIFQVLGAEFNMKENVLFKIEAYYKYYFDRLYLLAGEKEGVQTITAKTDGIGHATGFDFILQKRNGRVVDGYLSYSFVYAQYKNPGTDENPETVSVYGEPVGIWYYPGFHRFHNLNLIVNWKPVVGLVLTVKATVATGAPKERVGDIEMNAVPLSDGRVLERYGRRQYYDGDLRNDISCPVDLRLGYSNYYRGSKIRWEYYIGVENVFVNLYKPRTTPGFDEYTGKEIANSDSADFSLPIPTPSVGFKISY